MTNGTNVSDVTGLRVVGIFISPGHDFFGHHEKPAGSHPTISLDEVDCVAGKGLFGDRFFGFKDNYKGQVTFFSNEVFTEVCRQLNVSGKLPGATRRNVITRGVDLNLLVGKKFVIQGVEFEGVCECSPCHWMNEAIASGMEALLHGHGGLRARILTDGVLRVDGLELSNRTNVIYATHGMGGMKFSAVILAGGKSSRMGRDKAWLQVDGESLLARQIRVVREVGASEVLISGRADADYSGFDCRVLHDQRVEVGPLAGIESALAASSSSLLLVLAVDLPKMQVELLRQLASRCDEGVGAIPLVDGVIEPLAAFYPKVAVDLIVELFAVSKKDGSGGETLNVLKKSPSATTFAGRCVECGLAKFVDVAASETHFFTNWNSPSDLK